MNTERFDAEYQRIFSKYVDDEMTGLSEEEVHFIFAMICLNESMNGSLAQYYCNSYGDDAAAAVDAFRHIGGPVAARILERANALFGKGGPSKDRVSRQAQLDALSERSAELLEDLSDELNSLEESIRDCACDHLD